MPVTVISEPTVPLEADRENVGPTTVNVPVATLPSASVRVMVEEPASTVPADGPWS